MSTAPTYPGRDAFEPPTGPEAKPYTRDDNRRAGYAAFLRTEEGREFLVKAAGAASYDLARGATRFSVLGYIHAYRANHKVRINNTWAPWIADELVMRHPRLEDIIERRARKTVGA